MLLLQIAVHSPEKAPQEVRWGSSSCWQSSFQERFALKSELLQEIPKRPLRPGRYNRLANRCREARRAVAVTHESPFTDSAKVGVLSEVRLHLQLQCTITWSTTLQSCTSRDSLLAGVQAGERLEEAGWLQDDAIRANLLEGSDREQIGSRAPQEPVLASLKGQDGEVQAPESARPFHHRKGRWYLEQAGLVYVPR